MKHLKTYENNNPYDYYWLVPTDERLSASLKKIGCSLDIMNNSAIYRYKYIFVGKYLSTWVWAVYDGEEKNISFENNGNIYAGKVNVSDVEIKADKYNL